jgi:hypothetical protein
MEELIDGVVMEALVDGFALIEKRIDRGDAGRWRHCLWRRQMAEGSES